MGRHLAALIALVAAAAAISPRVSGCDSLGETISKIPNLSILHKIITLAGDDEIFWSSGFNGTLLAPVDTAFEKLFADANSTATTFMSNEARVRKILEDIVIPTAPADLLDGTKLKAGSGIPISVTAEGSWTAFVYPTTVATVVLPKIAACDAVFYVVDRVFPPTGAGGTSAGPNLSTLEPTSEPAFSPAPAEPQKSQLTQLTKSGVLVDQDLLLAASAESNITIGTVASTKAPLTSPEPAPNASASMSGFFPPSQNFTEASPPLVRSIASVPAPEPFVEFNTTSSLDPLTTALFPSITTVQSPPALGVNASNPNPEPQPVLQNDTDTIAISRQLVPAAELIPAPEPVLPPNASMPSKPREATLWFPPLLSSKEGGDAPESEESDLQVGSPQVEPNEAAGDGISEEFDRGGLTSESKSVTKTQLANLTILAPTPRDLGR